MIVLLVGPPGSGKSTIEKELVSRGLAKKLISSTTRKPRPGEVDGVDYYFVSRENFNPESLVEFVLYDGNFYGLSKEEVDKTTGNNLYVAVVEMQGAVQLTRYLKENPIIIFLSTPKSVLKRRLIQRNTPDRMSKLDGDNRTGKFADYIVNTLGKVDDSIDQILTICSDQAINNMVIDDVLRKEEDGELHGE